MRVIENVRRQRASPDASWVVATFDTLANVLVNLDSESMRADTPQECPICGSDLPRNGRYPKMLCGDCMDQATDELGRRIEFANFDATGGFQAFYVHTGEPYRDHVCFVRGVRCCAHEAHFGGIVIQPIDPKSDPSDR